MIDTTGARRGSKRWRVVVDGKEQARFSRMEDAVEAVDYEVGRKGKACAASARPSAAWRRAPVPHDLALALAERRLTAATHGEALRLLAFAEHGPRRSRPR